MRCRRYVVEYCTYLLGGSVIAESTTIDGVVFIIKCNAKLMPMTTIIDVERIEMKQIKPSNIEGIVWLHLNIMCE